METIDDFPMDREYPNIIDSNLAGLVREHAGDAKIAVVLSNGLCLVNGFYSTEIPRIPTSNPMVRFNNVDYSAERIAEHMARFDLFGLIPFMPYEHFMTEGITEKGFIFHLLVASDIPDKNMQNIAFAIDSAWKKAAGYHLDLVPCYD